MYRRTALDPEANDIFEDNDTFDTATPVACGEAYALVAYTGDDDWFRITVPEGQGLKVQTTGDVADKLYVRLQEGPLSDSIIGQGVANEIVEAVPSQTELAIRVIATPGDAWRLHAAIRVCARGPGFHHGRHAR